MSGDGFGQLGTVVECSGTCLVAMNQVRQRIDGFLIDQDVDLHDVGLAVLDRGIVKGPVSTGDRLELAVEVEEDFSQWHFAGDFDPADGEVVHGLAFRAMFSAEFHDRADVFFRGQDRGFNVGFGD